MSKLKTIKNINVKNKRVLMRVDFNIPFTDTKIDKSEVWKIEATFPTLRYLIKNKAKIILITHLGRPQGEVIESLRLDLVASELQRLLKKKVKKVDSVTGRGVREITEKMKSGEVVMLENVRFYPGEEENSPKFAKELARLGDIFINDAFAVSHRKHASIVGVSKHLPAVAGLLLEKEIEEFNKVLHKSKHPLIFILGGAKVSTKIKIIKKCFKKADKLLLGGAIVNTIFAAEGMTVGKSFVEEKMFKVVRDLDLDSPKLQLPVDVVCENHEVSIRNINTIGDNESVFDIGPKTAQLFSELIKHAKMIVWNGPVGMIEKKPFDRGSEMVARAIIQSKAYTIIGGGDSVSFIRKLGLEKKFNYISTGGGAMLEYLVNETLSGIEVLKK